MAKQEQITRGSPLSLNLIQHLKGSGERRFLQMLASDDVTLFHDDFLGDTINLDMYAVANSGGAGAANFAVPATAITDGAVTGATGTTDNGSLSLFVAPTWYGDQNCGMVARIKYDLVTGINGEVGFIDAVPGSNGSGVSDVDTPAATATDCALWQIDTDQTLQTAAFVTAGSTFTTTKTTLDNTGPTAATYMKVRVELRGNSAKCWVNGVAQASHDGDKVEGGNKLGLWVYLRTRDTTTKIPTLDRLLAWQDRAA